MKDEQATWQYDPDGKAPPAGLSHAVDEELKKPTRGGAKPSTVSWTASEYIDHKQGPRWFGILGIATVVIAVLIFLLTRDYFTIGVVLMLGIIIGLFARRTPRNLQYELSADGLTIGQKVYPYSLFKSFSVMQDGSLLSLSLMPIKRFMPPIAVYFSPADQEKIINFLQENLPFEERKLDFVDRLTRSLHF